MLCCLMIAAGMGPFALWLAPGADRACCAGRRRWLLAAAAVLSIGAGGAALYLFMHPVPFRHICRFLGASGS